MGHQYDLVHYFFLYDIDGHRGTGHCTSSPNQDLCKLHLEQMHPKMKILRLHTVKTQQEADAQIATANIELAKDPNWFPWTNADVKASANATIVASDLLPPNPALVK